MKFEEGDIVELLSGGPQMTVESFSHVNGKVVCQWFAGKKLEKGYFSEASLKKSALKPEKE